jgi:hypothetical protein
VKACSIDEFAPFVAEQKGASLGLLEIEGDLAAFLI